MAVDAKTQKRIGTISSSIPSVLANLRTLPREETGEIVGRLELSQTQVSDAAQAVATARENLAGATTGEEQAHAVLFHLCQYALALLAADLKVDVSAPMMIENGDVLSFSKTVGATLAAHPELSADIAEALRRRREKFVHERSRYAQALEARRAAQKRLDLALTSQRAALMSARAILQHGGLLSRKRKPKARVPEAPVPVKEPVVATEPTAIKEAPADAAPAANTDAPAKETPKAG